MLFSRCEQQKSLSFLPMWDIVEDKPLPFVFPTSILIR